MDTKQATNTKVPHDYRDSDVIHWNVVGTQDLPEMCEQQRSLNSNHKLFQIEMVIWKHSYYDGMNDKKCDEIYLKNGYNYLKSR